VGGEHQLVVTLGSWMRAKLARNRGKLHWRSPRVTDGYLLDRLEQEVRELRAAVYADVPHSIWAEAADVANFAAMLADRSYARHVEELNRRATDL
jgi:hypothetical protein